MLDHLVPEARLKTPVVLLDDPAANDEYDLEAILRKWPHGIAGIITPLDAAMQVDDGWAPTTDATAVGSAEGEGMVAAGRSDSETTLTLKRARIRYRLRGKGAARELDVATSPPIVRALGASLLVVGFVSAATFPLLVALGQHADTRDLLRVGITGVRLDHSYNLARKLIVDGVISYHEHTRTMAKVLCARLELMRVEHLERLRSAGR